MATSFLDIYTRAMTMLKSPLLSRLQKNDLLSFCIVMSQYLQTGLTFYNPNEATFKRVNNIQEPTMGTDNFVGNGFQTSFVLGEQQKADTIFSVTIDEISQTDYTYNLTDNSIVFTVAPINGAIIVVENYNNGIFLGDITNEDITLLAIATCWAWAIQIDNTQLDIDRSLNDSGDFKQHSNATTTDAKVSWVKHFEEMFKRELSKADYRSMFRRKYG